MSLNWNLTAIKDHETLCWGQEHSGRGVTLSRVTDHLIWSTITVGMNQITEANWEEFYAREFLQWHVYGGIKVTPEQVRAHIGLKTNASPITAAKFNAAVIKHLRRDAADRVKLATASLVSTTTSE